MRQLKWSVVVPSNRPEKLLEFKQAWLGLFSKHNVNLIVVEDAEPYEGIPEWIPRKTDMIRSWGFWKAFEAGSEFTLSLDDDVRPLVDVFHYYEYGFNHLFPLSEYLSVGSLTDSAVEMRGFPYKNRGKEVVVQYGGWAGVPDLDSVTQINHPRDDCSFLGTMLPVPLNVPVTCCAMNFAFRTEYTPIMFQLPLYEGEYNRFGDIWSGLIQKRVLDWIGKVMLINGSAGVLHQRASDPFVNLQKEAPGLPHNEVLWNELYCRQNKNMIGAYMEAMDCMIDYFSKHNDKYAKHLAETMYKWLKLFS